MNGYFFHSIDSSDGSVILPISAEAATVDGDAKNTLAFLLPILPGKFLLADEMIVSPSAGTPKWVPTQGPQPGGIKVAPDFDKIENVPSSTASSNTFLEAGVIINRTPTGSDLPLRILRLLANPQAYHWYMYQ